MVDGVPGGLLSKAWRDRGVGLAVAVFVGYLLFIGWSYLDGHRKAAAGESPLFTDYTSTYAASLLMREAPAANVYVTQAMYQAELEAARAAYDHRISEAQAREHGFARWAYPPLFLLFVLPLAAMPYLWSLLAWSLVTALPYLAALRSILGARPGWALALAAPPTFYNLMFGQTGFLSAGFIGLGLYWLGRYPLVAGVWIGLAAFKPNLGVLIPFALVAGGHWRAFFSASLTVLLMIVASVLLLGPDPWLAYIGTAHYVFDGFAIGAYSLATMITPLSSALHLGLPLGAAVAVQGLVALAALVLLVVVWWGDSPLGLKSALLCSLALLVTPMAYFYDMTLLVPAVAWLLADMHKRGGRAWELGLLAALVALMFLIKPVAKHSPLQLAPLIPLALSGWALARLRTAARVGGRAEVS